MVFYILTPHKIQAYEHNLDEFIADDLLEVIPNANTKIATDVDNLCALRKAYPTYRWYEVHIKEGKQ